MRLAFAAVATLFAAPVLATAPTNVVMTLEHHRFTPSEVVVPAGQRIIIQLINRDSATEEFDSHDLKVEKLVTPNGHATFSIGPLQPGAYSFMGEFHPATAQGRVIAAGTR